MIDLEHWKNLAREDTCLDQMVPGDLRSLVSEIEALRDALRPFAIAAQYGQELLDALKALPEGVLVAGEHPVRAANHRAQGKVCWNDWKTAYSLMSDQNTEDTAIKHFKTLAGSTVELSGNHMGVVTCNFDWFEEPQACCDCVVEPYPLDEDGSMYLTWTCDHCGGGKSPLTKTSPQKGKNHD